MDVGPRIHVGTTGIDLFRANVGGFVRATSRVCRLPRDGRFQKNVAAFADGRRFSREPQPLRPRNASRVLEHAASQTPSLHRSPPRFARTGRYLAYGELHPNT